MAPTTPIIKKITLLLRKAESTTFPAEREALREQAERMAVRHGIEQATIEAAAHGKDVRREEIVRRRATYRGAYWSRVNLMFAHLICLGLGDIRTLQFIDGRTARTLTMVGFQSDVDRAQLLIESLRIQADIEMTAWWKHDDTQARTKYWTKNERDKARGDFIVSFARAAGWRLRERRQEALDEVKGTGTDLVLASRLAQVDEACGYGALKPARRATEFSGSVEGYRAGQRARLGDNEINGRRSIIESR